MAATGWYELIVDADADSSTKLSLEIREGVTWHAPPGEESTARRSRI
jgi:hypothetical protein